MIRLARLLILFVSGGAVACGGGSSGGETRLVGMDDGGTGPTFVMDSSVASTGPLDAYFEEQQMIITFVSLHCAGDCVDVQAVATGGNPPYTYSWDDGSTNAIRHLCPNTNTSYHVKVTDSGRSGEFAQSPVTVTVPLAAYVLACLDAGASPDGCDSVTNVSPSGANPYGPWSYGWSASLGAAFKRQTEFLQAVTGYGGINAWSSSVAGIQLNPASYCNPTISAIRVTTLTAQPGQFFLHPGPIGQYSIARWTAPRAGTYVVRSTFEGIDIGPTTTDVHVQHNGVDVASGNINVNGGGNAYQSSPSITVASGDTIDFVVGNGGNGYNNDSTALSASLCAGTGTPTDGGAGGGDGG